MNAPLSIADRADTQPGEGSMSLTLLRNVASDSGGDEHLLELINVITRYQRMRNLSYQERFGKADPGAEQALAQLEEARRMLLSMSAKGEARPVDVALEAQLNVTLKVRADEQ